MEGLGFSYQNIVDANGIAIAITGMVIVFTALTIISIFITVLPSLSAFIGRVFPEGHHHGSGEKKTRDDDDKLLAAIGFGLYKARGKGTIKK